MAWILLFLCWCAALSQPLTLSSSTVPSTSPIFQSHSPTAYKRTKYPTKYPTKPPTSSSPSSSPIVIIVSDQVQPTIAPHSQAPSSEPTAKPPSSAPTTKLPSSAPTTKPPSSKSPTLPPTQHTQSPTWQTEGVAEETPSGNNNPSIPVGTEAVPATFAFFALLAVPVVGAAMIVHRRRVDNRQHALVDSLQRVWGSSREFLVMV